jgi:hypothetical protein
VVQRTEKWRIVPSLPAYAASSEGNVKRIAAGRGATVGKICKPYLRPDQGYFTVRLSVNCKLRTLYVHRLVAEAFHGPLPVGLTINYKDGNKLNNRPGNLEYVPYTENNRHAIRIGLTIHRRGENHQSAILTAKQVKEIRRLRGQGWTYQRIADKFSICYTHARSIALGHCWKSVI